MAKAFALRIKMWMNYFDLKAPTVSLCPVPQPQGLSLTTSASCNLLWVLSGPDSLLSFQLFDQAELLCIEGSYPAIHSVKNFLLHGLYLATHQCLLHAPTKVCLFSSAFLSDFIGYLYLAFLSAFIPLPEVFRYFLSIFAFLALAWKLWKVIPYMPSLLCMDSSAWVRSSKCLLDESTRFFFLY